ncbi:MAG: hypothetical protein IKA65_02455 [Lentisphaeria bacterium]|nr:hypothetical protein [Lentisphaeria bacterium]
MKKIFSDTALFILAAGSMFMSGCSSPRTSDTGRTAVEQFLISTVIENGIGYADFKPYKGKKIFIEYDYLAPQVDKPYVQGIFEMHLAENGLLVCRDAKSAEYIVQILCGVLATDANTIMIGTPSLPIPLPDTSINVAIPEIPLFKKLTRSGYGKFAFNVLKAKDRAPVKVINGIEASTSYTNWTILLIPFKSHDMPLKIREGSETHFNVDSGSIR